MADSELDRLLGYRGRFGNLQIRLNQVLGGGATAVVFCGVDANHPDDRSRDVAVKVARAEDSWQQALAREWHNLRVLEKAEQARGSHYFPRILYPDSEQELRQDLHPAGRRMILYILIQELVPGSGVHDLLLGYPGLRFPEPLALEMARQYAEMLTILHSAGLTCADRKLSDLRWQKSDDFTPGDRETLSRWPQKSPGHLMVLDWNVTEKASDGTIALDLFRFGILWHRMLLGVEPRFRRGESWQLEEPLEKHPIWSQLSFGTRQILSRLLYPVPERRYPESSSLLKDIESQIRRWQADAQTLESEFKEVYRRYIEYPTQLDQATAERALAAADALRVRIVQWGERQPTDFQNVQRSLQQAATESPFHLLQEALHKSRWDEALSEIEKSRAKPHNPARLLHLDRQRQIAARANETRRSWEQVKLLFEQSKLVFDCDRQERELSDAHIKRWQNDAEAEDDDGWKRIKNRLWQEAGYRLALDRARRLKDQGNLVEAFEKLKSAVDTLRELLAGHGSEIVTWLDQLYGDPNLDQQRLQATDKANRDRANALVRGLQILVDNVESEMATTGLAAALLAEPDNAVLAQAHRLLEAAQSYRRARKTQCLPLEIVFLEQLFAAYKRLAAAAARSKDNTLEQEWARIAPQITDCLNERRNELRDRVLNDIEAYSSMNALPFERPPEKAIPLLVQRYLEAFDDDCFKQKVEKWLKQPLPWNQENTESILKAIESHQAHWAELETILGDYVTAP